MRRAYSYVRFSSPEQATGDSYRRQTEFSQKYAERNGLVLDENLTIRDLGVSAFRGANLSEGALAGFVKAVEDKRVSSGSVLIVESLDRISRNEVRTALALFMKLLDAGITIVTLNPERTYLPDDRDVLSLVEPLFTFARANEESRTKSTRIAASWDQRRREAATTGEPMTTVCPAWIELADGKYRLVPERAKVVEKVFKWCRDGLGTFAIAKRLREEGVEPFGRSKSWNCAYVRLLLTDRRAMGEYQPKKLVYDFKCPGDEQKCEFLVPVGNTIPNYYPAVVTEAEFYTAAGTIKSRKGKGGRGGSVDTRNLLRGLVFNADDGQKMYYCTQKRVAYLDSTAGYYGEDCVKGRSFRYQPVEDCVLSLLTELTPAVVQGTPGENVAAERVAELSGRLAEVNAKIETVTEKARTAADYDVFLDLLAKLKADQKRIAGELEEAKITAAGGEAESVGEAQAVIALCRTQKGAQLDSLRRRLRGHVAGLIEAVWLKIEVHNRNKKTATIRLYLKDGTQRSRKVSWPPPKPDEKPRKVQNYADTDFRAAWIK